MKFTMSDLQNNDEESKEQKTLSHHKTLTEKKLHSLAGATATFNRSFKKMQSLEECSPNFNSNFQMSSNMESLLEHSHESFGDSPHSKPKTINSNGDFGSHVYGYSMTASPKKESR